jgi:exonuclease 1
MSWLYKGCYRCAYEHCQNIENNAFLYYIFEMLEILSYYGIKPILVFDGRYVGKKDETIEKRKKMKEENKQKGLELLEKGNEEEARKYLSRCIVIDEGIITLTMRAMMTKGIEFMVAPYESDSQMAKLVHLGTADFAITEDSDLILYHVPVVLKLSQDGDCDYINLDKWKPSDVDTAYLKAFLNMGQHQRVEVAVLAGCDYNPSIKGIGIKRAIKYLHEKKSSNAVIEYLRSKENYSMSIPENYENIIRDSKLIFTFATVFNPFENCLEFLQPHLI